VVAEALAVGSGMQAANLKVAELYVEAFSKLAKTGNTLIVPSNLTDVAAVVSTAMTVLDNVKKQAGPAPAPAKLA